MPVRFKGTSEYSKHFQWLSSPKSASFSPSKEQAADMAGLQSTELGSTVEPPLQRKKKPIPITTTATTKFTTEGQDYARPRVDFALLGPQNKFASNVQYRSVPGPRTLDMPSKKMAKTYGVQSPPAKGVAPAPKVRVDTGARRMPENRENQAPGPTKVSSKTAPPGRLVPPPPEQVRPALGDERPRPADPPPPTVVVDTGRPKPGPREKRVGVMNEFVQTDLAKGVADSGQEAPENYGLKYRAGIAPPRAQGPKRKTEYQNQFQWKKAVEGGPILRADQVVHNSNTALPQYRKDKIPRESEYSRQFKGWQDTYKPVPAQGSPKKSKLRRSKSEAALPPSQRAPAGVPTAIAPPSPEDKRLIKESLNPVRPFFPHGKHRSHKSEYHSNFKPPWKYRYAGGAWEGAAPPHVQPAPQNGDEGRGTTPSNWFAEVIELRKRADEYRKRAQGTHFSREHLVQLMARQADLWDQVSDSSTLSALSLEQPERKKQKTKPRPATGPAAGPAAGPTAESAPPKNTSDFTRSDLERISPVRRKLAWGQNPSTDSTRGSSASVTSLEAMCQRIDSGAVTDDEATLLADDDEGRVPTPRLRQTQAFKRHHLDRTTPATGGALLTSPPRDKKSAGAGGRGSVSSDSSTPRPAYTRPVPRDMPAAVSNGYNDLSSDVSSVELAPPPGGKVERTCGASGLHLARTDLCGSPVSDVLSGDSDPPGKASSVPSENQTNIAGHKAEACCNKRNNASEPLTRNRESNSSKWPTQSSVPSTQQTRDRSDVDRKSNRTGKVLPSLALPSFTTLASSEPSPHSRLNEGYGLNGIPTSPTFGKPTQDTHILNDDLAPYDKPMETRYVHSLQAKRDQPNTGKNEYGRPLTALPQRRQKLNIPLPINERAGKTYAKPTRELLAARGDEDDDVLSTSTRSLASSSSLASEVLDRARSRRDQFWGNTER